MKGIFITGTDTGVGKTFISCVIVRSLKKKGINVGVMKPVETGCKRKGDSLFPEDGILLKNASNVKDSIDLIVPYRFRYHLSPFMAAYLENRRISIDKIKNIYFKIFKKYDLILVEGAGGLMVPVTKDFTYLDLIKDLKLSVIIVASNRLGVINHVFLNVLLLRYNNTIPLCIILNNLSPKKDIAQKTNLIALKKIIKKIPILDFPYRPGIEFQENFIHSLIKPLQLLRKDV